MIMDIPFSITIFNWIYESGKYLLPFLFVLWLTWLICTAVLRKRKQFLCTSAVFFLYCILSIFFTWSGWHYRMKLRDRYAVVQAGEPGWRDSDNGKVYNIARMPDDIRREYAKDGYSPRRRGVVSQIILTIILIPFVLLGQLLLYRIFFRCKKEIDCGDYPSASSDWRKRLARACFIAGLVIGILNFLMTGGYNIWQLYCCIPLAFSVYCGGWKNWRIPAIVLLLIFSWGGVVSCVRDVKRAKNLKMISIKYHNRAGFDFEKVFPPLPQDIAVSFDGTWGMRFISLQNNDLPYLQFQRSLEDAGFRVIPSGSIVFCYDGQDSSHERIVSGRGFYKKLGDGFAAVAEYNGKFFALYIITGNIGD